MELLLERCAMGRTMAQAAGAGTPPPWQGGQAEPAASPARRASILIVEDELVVAFGVRRMLEAAGHRVCGVAATADAAEELARLHAPEVILMDVTLKGARDGILAATNIQAGQSPLLIFVTAHSDPATVARMEALHPTAILAKPFTEKRLAQLIQTALSGRPA